ncbi:hypothetical protein R1sor_026472 [Riccia sorocarpa]|uniref:Uncharacterized protein n=1 Tax=Riccia sorocarpa TaxID=122646 RepID=A0ABD3GFK0_9MARC
MEGPVSTRTPGFSPGGPRAALDLGGQLAAGDSSPVSDWAATLATTSAIQVRMHGKLEKLSEIRERIEIEENMTNTRSKGKKACPSTTEHDIKLAAVKVEPLKEKELLQFRVWGLGTLLNQDWGHLNAPLIREMIFYRDQKFAIPEHFNLRGQPDKWTSEVWTKVYHLPAPTLGGFRIMKATNLETLISLGVVTKRSVNSGIHKGDILVTPEFRRFCKVLNPIFTPQRPEYYQQNLLEFFFHAYKGLTEPNYPRVDWGHAIAQCVERQASSANRVADYCCLSPYLVHLYTMLGENQQVESFYSEVTPKPLKKVKKFVMDMSEDEETPPPTPSVADQTPPPQPEVRDMEVHMEEVFEDLASTWKSKALEVVNGFLKPISTYIIPTPLTVDPEVENLKMLIQKWQDLATSHHEQLRVVASKLGKLQLTFLELEEKTARMETTLAARTNVKEIRETLFPKYLATLRSNIEDVTRIAELEAHMEGLGLDIPEKVTPSPPEALRSQLLAQMEGLARVLLGEEKGHATLFKWTHGTREELMAHVIPDSLEVEIGGSNSS